MKLGHWLGGNRGGILTLALAFMGLALPLAIGTLAFAATLARQSQVQGDLLRAQYGGGGVRQYAIYKLLSADSSLVNNGDSAPLDQLLSAPATVTLDGTDYTITWAYANNPQDTPATQPVVFQTTQPATTTPDQISSGATSVDVTYTLQVQNISSQPQTLVDIRDSIPAGFTYESGTTTFEGSSVSDPSIETVSPPWGSAGKMETLTWDMQASTTVDAGATVTLEFHALTPSSAPPDGTYCNIAWVDPGGAATGTASDTGKLTVGSPSVTQCAGELLHLTKTVCVLPNCTKAVVPYGVQTTYEYTIKAENSWTQPIYVCGMFDDLPGGLTWNNAYTSNPSATNVNVDSGNSQQVDFKFQPNCNGGVQSIAAGQTGTFTLQADGALGWGADGSGVFQNSVRMMLALSNGGTAYWASTGLTAPITVYNVFWITVDDGTTAYRVEIWINADGSSTVGQWEPI